MMYFIMTNSLQVVSLSFSLTLIYDTLCSPSAAMTAAHLSVIVFTNFLSFLWVSVLYFLLLASNLFDNGVKLYLEWDLLWKCKYNIWVQCQQCQLTFSKTTISRNVSFKLCCRIACKQKQTHWFENFLLNSNNIDWDSLTVIQVWGN